MIRKVMFTDDDVVLLGKCITLLIRSAEAARTHFADRKIQFLIDEAMAKLTELDNKIQGFRVTIRNNVYHYDFYNGNKGIVFALCEKDAIEKVFYEYGSEYCSYHKLTVNKADMWGLDVYCTKDTWN